MPEVMPRTPRRGKVGRFDKHGARSDGRFSLHPETPILESRMHANVPVRFGRGRLDSLGNKGLTAYLIARHARRVGNPVSGNGVRLCEYPPLWLRPDSRASNPTRAPN